MLEAAIKMMIWLLMAVLIIGIPFAIACAIIVQVWRWLM